MLFALAELIYYLTPPLKREEGGKDEMEGGGDLSATDELDSEGGRHARMLEHGRLDS